MTEHDQSPSHDQEKTRVPVWLIVVGVLVVAAVIFVLQNTETIKMEFLMFDQDLPLWVRLVIFFVLGFLVAEVWGYMRRRSRRTPTS